MSSQSTSPSVDPPRDPRNTWRVVAANGWTREVASNQNAQLKAKGYDRGCPPRECPHRVQHWTGKVWVDVERTPDPSGWRVIEDCGVYDLDLVLGNPSLEGTDRDMRLVIHWDEADDEPQVSAVYPCGVCGWAGSCEDGCHV